MCLRTENFQQVERAIIEEETKSSTESLRSPDSPDGPPSPPVLARGLSASSPIRRPDTPRGRLLMMVERIRAQRDAEPDPLTGGAAAGLEDDYKAERTEREETDEIVIGTIDLEAGMGVGESHLTST